MAYRAPKSRNDLMQKQWLAWLYSNARTLKELSLPPELTTTSEHWMDFLQNGHLHWHPESNAGFELNQMSKEQMAALLLLLLLLLEASDIFSKQPMVGWLRHRLGVTE